MGKHLAHSRTHSFQPDAVKPQAIRYTFAKRLAIATDYQAGIGYKEICLRHNVAKATVHAILHDEELMQMIDPKLVQLRRDNLANVFEYQADVALGTLNAERWNQERATSVMIGAATAVDKARLLRNESTQNVSVRGVAESASNELELLKKRRLDIETAILDAEIVDNKHSVSTQQVDSKVIDNQQDQLSTDLTHDQ